MGKIMRATGLANNYKIKDKPFFELFSLKENRDAPMLWSTETSRK
jgi:hypothetical protein